MKNNKWLIMAGVVSSLGFATAVQATLISGNIGFNGNVNLDTATALTATTVTGWSDTGGGSGKELVTSGTSTLSGAGGLVPIGTEVSFSSPWTFYPGGSGTAPNPLWTVTVGGVTTSFNLQSWTATRSFNAGSGTWSDAVGGMGLLSTTAAGYVATLYNFSVTFQDPASNPGLEQFTFSASQAPVPAVPDGGMTVMLLGAALSGLGLLRKKVIA
jgi:hypothetical protein